MMPGTYSSGVQTIGMDIKKVFFDKAFVAQRVDDASRRVLSKFGAFVRRTAIFSIPSSDTVSKPGMPPHSHVGAQRRRINRKRKAQGQLPVRGGFKGIKQIYFAYNPVSRSVVIGPVKANIVYFDRNRQPVTGTVPQVLEYGGAINILEYQVSGGVWYRADLRSRRSWNTRKTRFRTVNIAPRPFMVPAYQNETPKLPGMWAGSIK